MTNLKIGVPATLLKPINVPLKMLLGPGPANAPPRVLASGSLPILGHLHPEFCKIMDECKEGIQYLFQTENKATLCVSGTGHAAMEMACFNMVERGDKVLVFTSGIWGNRFTEIVKRVGGVPIQIHKPGNAFSHEEIEKSLQEHQPSLVFITHGESSSVLHQSIENLGQLIHKYNALLIVDSVASAGGVPIFMDKWEIDVLYTGSQKCLGAPPGASPISFSSPAWTRYLNRKEPPTSYYMDLGHLANYWGCDDASARSYHHTAPITSVYQLREALAILAEDGLESWWARHEQVAEQLRDGVKKMGLELYQNDSSQMLNTITGVVVPAGVDWKAVSIYLMKNYRVELAGGLGHTAGKIWRIGMMGHNARPHNVQMILRCFAEALQSISKL